MTEQPIGEVGNVVVFGIGSMGRRYRRILRENIHVPDGNVFLCDTKDGQSGPQWFDGPDYLPDHLDPYTVDVAIISTPADSHVDYLNHVAEVFPRAAVLVEKPLANGRLSDHEPQLVPSLFTRSIAVGYNWRFHPWVKALKSKEAPIADLSLYVSEDMKNWPGKSYGLPLYEFSHEIDMVRVLLDRPVITDVSYSNYSYRIRGEHALGQWKVVIRTANCQKSRWFRVRVPTGVRMSGRWPTDARTIQWTYLNQLENLIRVSQQGVGPEGLECPLWDGVATAMFVDDIAASL
jgi:predicted dehydrogenase